MEVLRSIVFALLFFPAAIGAFIWCVVLLGKILSVALPGRRPDWRDSLLRWGAGMAGAAAVILYFLGAGNVAMSVNESSHGADSTPAHECRDAYPMDRLRGQRGSYFPLGFDCVLDDGSTGSSTNGYFWLNTSIAVSALTSFGLVITMGGIAEHRARVALRKPLVTTVDNPPDSDTCS
ncbi:hypothetical protein [Streptomyces sp. LaPpAH-108]|uniref:hypothetical protein n=1 Tax=Streptomyces sp. LaPpAH-108 TaxID=1155714 RepID=UPI00037E120C|nr:hypothetical protein [Streptomyces sp. LaPpAH-108]